MSLGTIASLIGSELNHELAHYCQALAVEYISLTPFSIQFVPWSLPENLNAKPAWWIFLSPSAVNGFATQWKGAWPHALIAIGPGTKSALAQHTDHPILMPSTASSEGLLALKALHQIDSQTIVLVKGEGGRTFLSEQLQQRGALIQSLLCYQRVKQAINIAPIQKIWQNGDQLLLVATSFTAIDSLNAQLSAPLRDWLLTQPLLVSSKRLSDLATDSGFKLVRHTTALLTATTLFKALKDYL